MVTYADLRLPDSSYACELTLLVGKQIKEVRGYFADAGTGVIVFKISAIELEDGGIINVEGEHDLPYIPASDRFHQPNMDDETLERLYDEQESTE